MMKKVLAMLLAGVMVMTSACGGTAGQTTGEKATEETTDSGKAF